MSADPAASPEVKRVLRQRPEAAEGDVSTQGVPHASFIMKNVGGLDSFIKPKVARLLLH